MQLSQQQFRPATQHQLACRTQRRRVLPPARAAPQQRQQHQQNAAVVFTTPGCQFCRRAKQTLAEQGVAYREVDVSTSSQLRQALQQATGQKTVPQVFVNGELVGGSDSLAARVADGSLASILASATAAASLPQALQEALLLSQEQAPQPAPAAAGAGTQPLPPDLQQLAAELLEGPGPAATQTQAAAFTGQALTDWIQQHGDSADRQAALAAAQQLLAANVVTLVSQQQPSPAALARFHDDAAHTYRLRRDAPRDLPWGTALNTAYWWSGASSSSSSPVDDPGSAAPASAAARPAGLVAEELRGRILSLFDAYLTPDGRGVRYSALKQDPAFWEYVDATAELQRVDLSPLSREELMCFGINLYNALCIHALVVHGPERYNSFFGRLEFFRKAARYNIGGCDYVLDDLENGLLRGNAPGAATVGMLLKLPWLSQGPFRQGDPRAQHVVSPVDPRIHFALNCGAVSCPPIKLYRPDTLQEGLSAAAEAFCASEVAVDVPGRQVSMSKIFNWYYPDFGPDKAARLRFLLPHLPPDSRASLEALLADDPQAQRVRVRFTPYDWTINGTE